MGSGNDWARSLGFPRDMDIFLYRLRSDRTVPVDAALASYVGPEGPETRYFINVAGLAYDASVALAVQGKQYRFPRWLYLYEAVRKLFSYRAPEVRLRSDGLEHNGPAFTINVGVQPYSGGAMQLVPHAKGLQGRMALTVLEPRPGIVLLPQMIRLFNGTLCALPYAHCSEATRIEIEHIDAPVPLEADGEFLGYTPVTFTILPGALNVPC